MVTHGNNKRTGSTGGTPTTKKPRTDSTGTDSDVDAGQNHNPNPSESNTERKDEFGGATLTEILTERSISNAIQNACKKNNISSVARLRRLTYDKLEEYFKLRNQFDFIDWKHMEGLWSGDVLPVDYIPPVRKQCREYGIRLKFAQVLEKLEVSDLKEVDEATLQDVRKQLIEYENKESENENINDKNKDEVMEDDMEEDTEDEQGEIDQLIEDLRSAVAKVKDGRASNIGEEEEEEAEEPTDEEKLAAKEEALVEASEQLNAARENSLNEAREMRSSLQEAMNSLDTKELENLTKEELLTKLEEVKNKVQAPSEMDDVGKNFQGYDSIMANLNTEALFDLYPDYIPSYTDDKDLIAAASGGIALNGIGVFSEMGTPFVSSTMPVLAPPGRVTTLGTFSAFESKILKTTMESEAAAFQADACSFGMSMAESVQSEGSVSASVRGRFVSANSSGGYARRRDRSESVQRDSNSSSFNNRKTQSAQITEYIMMPMRAFRIPRTEVRLSDEAIYELRKVTDEKTAKAFFSKFGTHVSRGRHTMGGVFFRKISLTSDQSLSANKMFSSAGRQLEDSKTSSAQAEASVSVQVPSLRRRRRGGGRGASSSVSASHSKGRSSSMGSVEVSSEENSSAKASCTYTFESRCMGPNASTPEEFAHVLQANNATWACIDRGDPTSLMPIWEIVETTHRDISETAKKLIAESSVSIDGSAKKTEKMSNNKKLACLLKTTWLGMLSPRMKAHWETNPSIKYLLRQGYQDRNQLYEGLAAIILEFAGLITYRDIKKYDLLKRGVVNASSIMSDSPRALPAKSWLTDFLSLGKDKDELFKTMKDTDNIDENVHLDAAYFSAGFSSEDWGNFNNVFQGVLNEHWISQQQARLMIRRLKNVQCNIIPVKNEEVCWDVCGGKKDNRTELQLYKHTNRKHKNASFKVECDPNGNDDFFRLIPQCATDSRVDIGGSKTYIWALSEGHKNQKFVLYKPTDPTVDQDAVIILTWRNMRESITCDNVTHQAKMEKQIRPVNGNNLFKIVPNGQ